MENRSVSAAAMVAALAAGLWLAPGDLLATLSPDEQTTADAPDLGAQRAELERLRETLTRRAAFRRTLQAHIDNLAREMERLRQQREATDAVLGAAEEEARRLERRLDHLLPRLVARGEAVDRRRAQAARALADLAGLSRHVEIDPTMRARMLAVGPLMLERLQSARHSLSALREDGDRAIARHHELQRETPLLRARRQQIERQRAQLQRRQAAVAERHAALEAEVEALAREETALAREVLITEAARAIRAEPQAAAPAWRGEAIGAGDREQASEVTVKGRAGATAPLSGEVDAAHASAPRLQGTLEARRDPDLVAGADAPVLLPPPAKPDSVVAMGSASEGRAGTARPSLGRSTAVDLTAFEPGSASSPSTRVLAARLEIPEAPIMPLPGDSGTFGELVEGVSGPSIPFHARPGQAVAAPHGGRVVWAGSFKSYGPLLIIEQEDEYHVLLWGMSRLEVEEGDVVRAGQVVGVMNERDADPVLNLEVRRNGRPVNPLLWLAASSSKVRG